MQQGQTFQVRLQLPASEDDSKLIKITHQDETFTCELENLTVSMINNGDNSWSLVEGDLSQEQVNLIGESIEDFYKRHPPIS